MLTQVVVQIKSLKDLLNNYKVCFLLSTCFTVIMDKVPGITWKRFCSRIFGPTGRPTRESLSC